MTKQNVAVYFAGILDGDGTIGVKRRREGPYEYALYISICNNSEDLMRFLVKNIGGRYRLDGRKDSKYKKAYVWTIGNKNVLPILEECVEFSIVKRKHINLAIEYINTLGNGKIILTSEILDKRNDIYIEFGKINRKTVLGQLKAIK